MEKQNHVQMSWKMHMAWPPVLPWPASTLQSVLPDGVALFLKRPSFVSCIIAPMVAEVFVYAMGVFEFMCIHPLFALRWLLYIWLPIVLDATPLWLVLA